MFCLFADLDRPRREPSLYGSQNDIDRYDDRDRDYIRRKYLHERGYIDDHDYWQFRRYRDRNYLLDRDLYDARLKERAREYRDKFENRPDDWNRKPIWYCRRIIDYIDWPPLNGRVHDRYPARSIINDPPREPIGTEEFRRRQPIPDIPSREPIPVEDFSRRERIIVEEVTPPIVRQRKRIIVEEVVPPVPTLVESTEKVVLHIEHEPEYRKTNYKDFGYYTVDEAISPPEPPRRMIDNGMYDRNREVEALYSKPIKSNFKVTEIDDQGREILDDDVRRRRDFEPRFGNASIAPTVIFISAST